MILDSPPNDQELFFICNGALPKPFLIFLYHHEPMKFHIFIKVSKVSDVSSAGNEQFH